MKDITETAKHGRSRVTNRPASDRYGSTGRATVRRVRDLYRAHLARFGDGPHDPVTEAHALRAAELAVLCEDMRAKALAGEPIDPNDITRLESTANRAEKALLKTGPDAEAAALQREQDEIMAKYRYTPKPRED